MLNTTRTWYTHLIVCINRYFTCILNVLFVNFTFFFNSIHVLFVLCSFDIFQLLGYFQIYKFAIVDFVLSLILLCSRQYQIGLQNFACTSSRLCPHRWAKRLPRIKVAPNETKWKNLNGSLDRANLLYDNARPHIARMTVGKTKGNCVGYFLYSLYSPDLTPHTEYF